MSAKVLPGQLGLPGVGRNVSKYAALFGGTMKAVFEFKCRKCGELFDGATTSEAYADALTLGLLDSSAAPKQVNIHRCDARNTGVGDLVGYCLEN